MANGLITVTIEVSDTLLDMILFMNKSKAKPEKKIERCAHCLSYEKCEAYTYCPNCGRKLFNKGDYYAGI